MATYTTISEQRENNVITDFGGHAYSGLREIVDHIKNTELPEIELDLDEVMRLAIYIWNGHETDLAALTPERLAEIKEEEDLAYEGEFSTEADFAEEKAIDFGLIDTEAIRNVVIDWEGTYRYTFQYDFHNYEVRFIDGGELVMARYFWRSH
jgi:hypothetical protein